ncbi:MAG: hypothetical protein KGI54_15015, partial [Pseudomonadota bacterium]|nr:hypothetical protein [Pseudomonadota bacterium]
GGIMNWKDIAPFVGDAAPIIGGLLGGPAGAAVGSLVANALGTGATPDAVSQALKTDPAAAVKLATLQEEQAVAFKQMTLQQATAEIQAQAQMSTAQIAVNQTEATKNSLFVAGWRPFIGWSCGAAFCYAFILQPFMQFGLVAAGVKMDASALPILNLADMMPVLLGMLGLGGMRTFEKVKGASNAAD